MRAMPDDVGSTERGMRTVRDMVRGMRVVRVVRDKVKNLEKLYSRRN